jgi:hypothetical protein
MAEYKQIDLRGTFEFDLTNQDCLLYFLSNDPQFNALAGARHFQDRSFRGSARIMK